MHFALWNQPLILRLMSPTHLISLSSTTLHSRHRIRIRAPEGSLAPPPSTVTERQRLFWSNCKHRELPPLHPASTSSSSLSSFCKYQKNWFPSWLKQVWTHFKEKHHTPVFCSQLSEDRQSRPETWCGGGWSWWPWLWPSLGGSAPSWPAPWPCGRSAAPWTTAQPRCPPTGMGCGWSGITGTWPMTAACTAPSTALSCLCLGVSGHGGASS